MHLIRGSIVRLLLVAFAAIATTEAFDVGMDTGTGVALIEYRYDPPFRFTGKLDKLMFNLQPQEMTAEEQRVMQALGQRNNRASE